MGTVEQRLAATKDWLVVAALIAFLVLMAIISFRWLTGAVAPAAPDATRIVDYTNFTVILLTTVTVVFTIAAVLLAAGSIMGFRTMRRGASDYARRGVAREIDRAFEQGGAAYEEIRRQFTDPTQPLHLLLRHEIGRQLTEQLSLYNIASSADSPPDEEDPADEGQVS